MADTNIPLSYPQAVSIFNTIYVMSGGMSYNLLRKGIQDNLLVLWPELKEKDAIIDDKETRKLTLTSREQKAIAEGLLGLISKKDQSGQETMQGRDFAFMLDVAKTCKVSKWLISKVEAVEVPEFTDKLDDDPEISDVESDESPAA